MKERATRKLLQHPPKKDSLSCIPRERIKSNTQQTNQKITSLICREPKMGRESRWDFPRRICRWRICRCHVWRLPHCPVHYSKHGHLDVPSLAGWDAANGARARQNSNLWRRNPRVLEDPASLGCCRQSFAQQLASRVLAPRDEMQSTMNLACKSAWLDHAGAA